MSMTGTLHLVLDSCMNRDIVRLQLKSAGGTTRSYSTPSLTKPFSFHRAENAPAEASDASLLPNGTGKESGGVEAGSTRAATKAAATKAAATKAAATKAAATKAAATKAAATASTNSQVVPGTS